MSGQIPERPKPITTTRGVYDSGLYDKAVSLATWALVLGVAAVLVALLLWGAR